MHRHHLAVTALAAVLLMPLGCARERGDNGVFGFVPGANNDRTTAPQSDIAQRDVYAFVPETREPTRDNIAQLRTPDQFAINVWAQDLGHARMLAVSDNGTVYVTTPKQNRVLALRDVNGDGQADELMIVADNLPMVHGIAIHGNNVYLAAPKTVWVAQIQANGTLSNPRVIIDDLPDGGQHPNRTLAVGPDNMLYISVGSSCNACEETNPESATILRANLDGSSRTVFARGLRNTIGFGWHPQTGEMWGMDHGSDERGNDIPPEELNRIEEGNHYGWPWVFGKQQIDEVMTPPADMTKQEFAAMTAPSFIEYQAHAAPIQMTFYRGNQFPERYRNGAFVAMRGSWNRFPAVGYKVVFIDFESGEPVGFEDFVTGFLVENGQAQFARLAGIAVLPDGSLIFSDDQHGMIYRVTYGMPARSRTAQRPQ